MPQSERVRADRAQRFAFYNASRSLHAIAPAGFRYERWQVKRAEFYARVLAGKGVLFESGRQGIANPVHQPLEAGTG